MPVVPTGQNGSAPAASGELRAPLESGWEKPESSIPRRIIAAISGQQKNGKTRFSLSAPEPIFVHNFDDGLEGVVEDLVKSGKEIYFKRYRMPNAKMDEKQKQAAAEVLFDEYQRMWRDSVARGKGTIIVDTHSEEWEVRRLAAFGKLTQVMPVHYAEVNGAFRTDVREAYDSGMNVLLLQKMKKAYVGNNWNGLWEPAGYSDLPFLVQANLECFRDPADGRFKVLIKDCRQNAALANTWMDVDFSDMPDWMQVQQSPFEDFLDLVFNTNPVEA
jgi:hypothetical protein